MLAKRFPTLDHADAKKAVTLIFESITETLARGNRAEIRGFGSFNVMQRQSRIGRNPRTGEKVAVPAKSIPHFKPGKDLRERVDL
jgi:integration host factor subunit beta